MTAQTIEDVIEEQRILMGASELRVTLGPDATPDSLSEVLNALRERTELYNAFTPLEQKEAEVFRLRKIMRSALEITQRPLSESAEDSSKRLSDIFLKLDAISDVDLEEDTMRMISERKRKGLPLPELT